MRVNVYSQEFTSDVKMVSTDGTNEAGELEEFFGIRLYLHSSQMLHHNGNDDDRSAITLWLPTSDTRRMELAETLQEMAYLVSEMVAKTP